MNKSSTSSLEIRERALRREQNGMTWPCRAFVGVAMALLLGCHEPAYDYVAASSVVRNGFARDGAAMRAAQGKTVVVWGFVDNGNLYGDDGAKAILAEWWGGAGPSTSTWRFDLKAGEQDAAGHGFSVYVANDPGRDALLRSLVADARAHRSTKVFVKGRIFTFAAPTNFARLAGLHMEVLSSQDIRVATARND